MELLKACFRMRGVNLDPESTIYYIVTILGLLSILRPSFKPMYFNATNIILAKVIVFL